MHLYSFKYLSHHDLLSISSSVIMIDTIIMWDAKSQTNKQTDWSECNNKLVLISVLCLKKITNKTNFKVKFLYVLEFSVKLSDKCHMHETEFSRNSLSIASYFEMAIFLTKGKGNEICLTLTYWLCRWHGSFLTQLHLPINEG